MDRRQFLKIGGTVGTGGAAGLALSGCGGRGRTVLTGLVTDTEIIPGEESWVPAICTLCPGGCGILARVMEGRVVKIEGDPAHPVSRGGLCARGQAAVQALYNPDRVPGPMKRMGNRGEGRWSPASWEEALAQVGSALTAQAGRAGSKVLFITNRLRAHRAVVVDRFLRAIGAPPAMVADPFDEETVREAYGRLAGHHELPAMDLENCDYLLSVGASFVEAGPSPVRFQRGLASMRHDRPGRRGKLTHVEPRYSLTAAAADEWIPARPGTEGALLLALAGVLVSEKLHDADFLQRQTRGFDPEDWTRVSPEQAAEITGVKAQTIRRIARELAAHRPSCVVFGGGAAGHTNSLAAAQAAAALNALLGAYDRPGGLSFPLASWRDSAGGRSRIQEARPFRMAGPDLPERIESGRISALLAAGADPAHAMPSLRAALADMSKIPLVISFSSFPDDTAALADWILPDHTDLERLNTDLPEGASTTSILRVTPAAVAPFVDSRSLVETLLSLWPSPPPWKSEVDLIGDLLAHGGGSPDTTLAQALDEQTAIHQVPAHRSSPVTFAFPRGGIDFVHPRFERYPAEHPLILIPYPSLGLLQGQTANLPWMQELLDPMAQLRWGSWVEVNPKDARALGIAQGDEVVVSSDHGRIETKALLSEAVMPGTAAFPAGQGHHAYGRYAQGRGANIFSILAPVPGEAGGIAWGATRVSVAPAGERRV